VFQLRFDLRVPPFATTTHQQLYREAMDMVGWADDRGFMGIVLSEHHGVDDGYMSSPLTLAAGMLGRTRNLLCTIAALLVPYHDPLRVAEEVACADLLSGGNRLVLIIGLGYRESEFEMFGKDRSRRGRLVDEAVGTMLQAWTGEPFEYQGRTVRVTPRPVTRPHPTMMIGGSAEISARRAARFHLPFMPPLADDDLARAYHEEAERVGYGSPFVMMPSGPGAVIVSDDPDRVWHQIGPHALYDAQTYASWQYADQRSSWSVEAEDVAAVRASGQYQVVTPDDCVKLAREHASVTLHPLVGGIDPAIGWESLELVVDKVMPELAAG
jgi:alkanesulfonate monooxygenase SsuD/methylene tetrahydromethanopterin reductase-like flavin-dependent oxidoreductase (luciferase family)